MNYNGGLIDNRTEKKDYSHLEVGKSGTPTFLTKKEALKATKLFPLRNQKSTSSCGAHAGELVMSIEHGGTYEQAFIYKQRLNFPSEGMHHYDIGDILLKMGVCEYLGIEKTESAYNAYKPTTAQKKEALKLSGKAYIVLENDQFTIDDIAHISNDLKKPLILYVYWKKGEWTVSPLAGGEIVPNSADARHYVTVLPNSCYIEKGIKYCIIQDSITTGKTQIRHLSEDWISKRVHTGLYRQDFLYDERNTIIFRHNGYKFTRNLSYGMSGKDIKMLQETLQDLGLFPIMECSEYFGGITRQAVKNFQEAHRNWVLKPLGLQKPTGVFGKKTMEKLNTLLKG